MSHKYSVLAGFATFSNNTYWIKKEIDRIMLKYTGRADLELHASPIRTGKGFWRSYPQAVRSAILEDVLHLINDNYSQRFVLFGAVMNNKIPNVSETLFAQITSRFSMYLNRNNKKCGKYEKGLAIFDKSKKEDKYQNLSMDYQTLGNQWNYVLKTFAEVPVFLNSEMSRSIQVADLIAYSLFRYYEHNDDSYYSIIQNCFDKDAKKTYGLYTQLTEKK